MGSELYSFTFPSNFLSFACFFQTAFFNGLLLTWISESTSVAGTWIICRHVFGMGHSPPTRCLVWEFVQEEISCLPKLFVTVLELSWFCQVPSSKHTFLKLTVRTCQENMFKREPIIFQVLIFRCFSLSIFKQCNNFQLATSKTVKSWGRAGDVPGAMQVSRGIPGDWTSQGEKTLQLPSKHNNHITWGYPPPTNSEIIICSFFMKGPL